MRPGFHLPSLACVAGLLCAAALLPPREARAGIQGIFTQDAVEVWAVGDTGAVYRSFDGGATWTFTTLGDEALHAVAARGLAAVMAGDSGKVWRSADGGGSWALAVIPGAPALRRLAWPADGVLVLAGPAGTVWTSGDSGATWNPHASGVAGAAHGLRFRDASSGWLVGEAGGIARTVDGGASWVPVASPTSRSLRAVDFIGDVIWVVGDAAGAWRSATGGASWSVLDLGLDALSDVRAVAMVSPDSLWLAGGGGFLRRSADGGATWTFATHPLQAGLATLFVHGGKGWAASPKSRVVLRSMGDGGAWALPAGTTAGTRWRGRLAVPSGSVARGNTIASNPIDPRTFYVMLGGRVFRSGDEGETWAAIGTPVANATKANAFIVSPKDTNVFVALVGGTGLPGLSDRVVRSKDGGLNWDPVLVMDFGEYGVPLEMDPDHPDTLYFGPDSDVLYRSTDFGDTWEPWSTTSFRSPCDIVVVPASDSGVVLVGDGVTGMGRGELWRSVARGPAFTHVLTNPLSSSEIPEMASSRLAPVTAFATAWSPGGVRRSTDRGLTWSQVLNVTASWGVDIARDDPTLVLAGTYQTSNVAWISTDGGGSFTNSPLRGPNYAFHARDRETILAEESDSLYALVPSYAFTPVSAQALALSAPDGGEFWDAGEVHAITWSATNVAAVAIEFRTGPAAPWTEIARVPGSTGSHAWAVPYAPTTTAEVRVRDLWDSSPIDGSNGVFTLGGGVPQCLLEPDSLDLGAASPTEPAAGTARIDNPGTGPLVVASVTSDNPEFVPGRTAFTVPPGGSDTLTITYQPTDVGPDAATVTIVANDAGSPHAWTVFGHGVPPGSVGPPPLAFGLGQNRPNPFTGRTTIRYGLPVEAEVALEVFDLTGHRVATLVRGTQGPGEYAIPFGSGVTDAAGADLSRLRSGVYFYRLRAAGFVATRKMLLLR